MLERVFCCLLLVMMAWSGAQLSPTDDVLIVVGEVSFWPGGDATLEAGGQTVYIDEEGRFTLSLTSPAQNELAPVEDFAGVTCLTSSSPEALYAASSYFEVMKDGEVFAELYLQTPKFDFQLEDAYKEFHYYSEATVVSGSCDVTYDDGFTTVYVFPDLEMEPGWNTLTGTLTEIAETSETFTFSLDDQNKTFLWELEALPNEGNSYIGLGISVSQRDEGFVLDEVYEDSPAEEAGLMAGDVITHIDGESVDGMNMGALLVRLLGRVGEPVNLRLLRDGGHELSVTRGLIILD